MFISKKKNCESFHDIRARFFFESHFRKRLSKENFLVCDYLKRADRQTNRHTDTLIAIGLLRAATGDKVKTSWRRWNHIYVAPYVVLSWAIESLQFRVLATHRRMAVWRNGNALVSINEVNLHWARLVLGWVIVSGFDSQGRHFISVCKQQPRSTQPSIVRGTVKWVPAKGRWCFAAGE